MMRQGAFSVADERNLFTKDHQGNAISWQRKKAVIFDVDGTLYHQPPVRAKMAVRLAGYYLFRPRKIRELAGIRHFRKIREEESFRTADLSAQIREAAGRAGLRDADALQEAVRRWMFREPLREIAAHPRQEVLSFLKQMREEGRRIIIYSDYAAEEKLDALRLVPDAVYYPGVRGLEELKPSRKCMTTILEREGLRPDQAVMVGDRAEKDGESAALVGMQFILVS